MAINGIPDIPRPRSNDPETQRFYDAVSNAFRSIQRTDSQGLVTYDELGRRLLPLYNDYKALSSKVGGGDWCDGASVPAPVSNITTDGAFGVITIKWDKPVYRGHGHTEIYASATNDFATAEKAGDSADGMHYFEHAVPAIEFTTENNYEVTRYYWLRHVSACDKGSGAWSDMVVGVTPPSPTVLGDLMSVNAIDMMNALGLDRDLYSVVADARASVGEARLLADDMEELGTGVHELTSILQDANSSTVSHLEAVVAEFNGNVAGVITQIEAVATETTAEVDYSFSVLAEVGDNISGVKEDIQAEVTALGAGVVNTEITFAEFGENLAAVTTTVAARADEDSAYAMHQVSTAIETSTGYSAIDVKSEVDSIGARYTVQSDANGFIQGYGLLNTGSPSTSGMLFNVSNFYLVNFTAAEIATYNS